MIDGLPKEWFRGPQWSAGEEAALWLSRFAAAKRAWSELEILSVSAGIRDSALVHLTPAEIVQATRESAMQGLVVIPLSEDGRCAVTRPALFGSWLDAFARSDDEEMGKLLGFPPCCRAHFAENWGRGRLDTVLTMKLQATSAGLYANGPTEANLFLRHLGIRLVPHLPCTPTCDATRDLGSAIANAGLEAGVEVGEILRFLKLPVEYRALGSVAITTTPIFRFMSGTDYTQGEVVVRRAGSVEKLEPESWKDNGFADAAGMERAHDLVLATGNCSPETILDLGAGDGTLLEKFRARGLEASVVGVEKDPARAARGTRRYPSVLLLNSTIEEYFRPVHRRKFDLVLLMPGRLLEMDEADRLTVLSSLVIDASQILLYAYGDNLPLRPLAERAGFRLVGREAFSPYAEACYAEVA